MKRLIFAGLILLCLALACNGRLDTESTPLPLPTTTATLIPETTVAAINTATTTPTEIATATPIATPTPAHTVTPSPTPTHTIAPSPTPSAGSQMLLTAITNSENVDTLQRVANNNVTTDELLEHSENIMFYQSPDTMYLHSIKTITNRETGGVLSDTDNETVRIGQAGWERVTGGDWVDISNTLQNADSVIDVAVGPVKFLRNFMFDITLAGEEVINDTVVYEINFQFDLTQYLKTILDADESDAFIALNLNRVTAGTVWVEKETILLYRTVFDFTTTGNTSEGDIVLIAQDDYGSYNQPVTIPNPLAEMSEGEVLVQRALANMHQLESVTITEDTAATLTEDETIDHSFKICTVQSPPQAEKMAHCTISRFFTPADPDFAHVDITLTEDEFLQRDSQIWRLEAGDWQNSDGRLFSKNSITTADPIDYFFRFMEDILFVGEVELEGQQLYEVSFLLDMNAYVIDQFNVSLEHPVIQENPGRLNAGTIWIDKETMLLHRATIDLGLIGGTEQPITVEVSFEGFNEPVEMPDPE